MAIASGSRDDAAVRAGVQRWLRAHDAEDATVERIERPPAGLSSDTCFVTARWTGEAHELVVRIAPAGEGLFPTYDVAGQVAVQNRLHTLGVPTAPARYEPEVHWLGAPFMVMPRVPGVVVGTNPPYVRAGWLVDGGEARQRRVARSFLETLGRLHRITAGAAPSGPCLPDLLDEWCAYLDWAAGDRDVPAFLERARAWCVAERPDPEPPPATLWGDVQVPNCVFAPDGSVAALLDFELAGRGPAEVDLGWFEALHSMTVVTNGGTDLPGFGHAEDRAAAVARVIGRELAPLRWYEVFALLRSGAIMVRIARLLAVRGVDDSWLTRANPTEAALARMIA